MPTVGQFLYEGKLFLAACHTPAFLPPWPATFIACAHANDALYRIFQLTGVATTLKEDHSMSFADASKGSHEVAELADSMSLYLPGKYPTCKPLTVAQPSV